MKPHSPIGTEQMPTVLGGLVGSSRELGPLSTPNPAPPQVIELGGSGLRMSVSGLAGAQKVSVGEQACRPPGAEDAKCNRGRPLLPGMGCQLTVS